MKDGDFIRLDFDAFVKETEQLVDTTHEEVAKEHDLYNERVSYAPIPLIVGSGQIVKGLDRDLLEAEKGKEREVEIPPSEAFGDKDPKLVEIFPERKILSLPEFRKGDKYPVDGMEIRMNNRTGIIAGRFAGRYRIDFNHRWAGKTIIYKYKVTNIITKKDEKLRAIIESSYTAPDEFRFEWKGKDGIDIVLPDIVKLDQGWTMAKFKLVSDIRAHLNMKTVRLIEEYVKKEEEKAEEEQKVSVGNDHQHEHDHECDDPECKHATPTEVAKEKD
ncbi:MAG: peptidylprolyl isomerase [Candidatus Thermoplasmatota archaeon]|nr:peptidylprolyl isomerase [Candidatus Thermoplasmatota archaeon]